MPAVETFMEQLIGINAFGLKYLNTLLDENPGLDFELYWCR